MQASSTMNQSDIRGLVRHKRTRADIDILRHELCFLQTRVQQQSCLSQTDVAHYSYRACTYECHPYFQFSSIKEQLRRRADKRNLIITPLSSFCAPHILLIRTIWILLTLWPLLLLPYRAACPDRQVYDNSCVAERVDAFIEFQRSGSFSPRKEHCHNVIVISN